MSSEPLKDSRHEAFAQKVASGMELAMAYQSLYPGVSHFSAKSSASRLQKKVGDRIRFLQNEIAEKNLFSREKILLELQRIVASAKYDADKIKALALIAEMQGFNQPKQVNVYADIAPHFLSPDGTGDETE